MARKRLAGEIEAMLDELGTRLTTIYAEECRHGPGGIALTLSRAPKSIAAPAAPAGPIAVELDSALARLFGMARLPRFNRRGAPPTAPAEPAFADRWNALLSELAGRGGVAWLTNDANLDDGFVLHILRSDGEQWAITANQAHD